MHDLKYPGLTIYFADCSFCCQVKFTSSSRRAHIAYVEPLVSGTIVKKSVSRTEAGSKRFSSFRFCYFNPRIKYPALDSSMLWKQQAHLSKRSVILLSQWLVVWLPCIQDSSRFDPRRRLTYIFNGLQSRTIKQSTMVLQDRHLCTSQCHKLPVPIKSMPRAQATIGVDGREHQSAPGPKPRVSSTIYERLV